MRDSGFTDVHVELHDDLRTVVLGGHLDRRAPAGQDAFVAAVADAMVEPVVDYVRRSSPAIWQAGALAVAQPDALLTGGVTEFLRIGVLADVHSVPIGPHFLPELHVHLAAAARTSSWVENFPLSDDLLGGTLTPVNGALRPPERPGHGIIWDAEAMKRFAATRGGASATCRPRLSVPSGSHDGVPVADRLRARIVDLRDQTPRGGSGSCRGRRA